jgi:hypothetical protein
LFVCVLSGGRTSVRWWKSEVLDSQATSSLFFHASVTVPFFEL